MDKEGKRKLRMGREGKKEDLIAIFNLRKLSRFLVITKDPAVMRYVHACSRHLELLIQT